MTRPDRSSRPRAARWLRPLRLAVAGFAVLGIACAAAAAPVAATSSEASATVLRGQDQDQAPPSSAASDAPTAELVLAPVEPVLQEESEEFEFRVLIRNRGKQPIADGEVRLELRPQPLSDPDELEDGFPDAGTRIATAEARETAPGGTQEVSLRVPRDELLPDGAQEGVYLLRAALDAGTGPDRSTAAPAALAPIIWEGAGDADPVPLSTIVPLTLPSEVASMPTRQQLERSAQRLVSMIDAAERFGSTLAVDPRIIAGIRAYGEAAPTDAREVLRRLEGTSAPVFLLQFADADPAAQAALGQEALLEPLNLDFITKHGEFPEAEGGDGQRGDGTEASEGAARGGSGRTSDPAPTAGPAEPDAVSGTPPDLGELLAWPEESPTAWPAAGSTDPSTIDLLRRSGIKRVVVDSGNVTWTGGPRVHLRNGEKRVATAIVVDRELRLQAQRALAGEHEIDRSAGLGAIAAELVLAAQNDSAGLVLALDRGATAAPDLPSDASAALLETVADLDWVNPVPIAEQRSGDASLSSDRSRADRAEADQAAAAAEQRLEQLSEALGREPDVQAMSPLLVSPDELIGYQRARLLQLFATRYAGPDGGFRGVAERFAEQDAELLEGVRVTRAESTHLVGTSTRVPVQMHNSLPFDAMIEGEAIPSSAALRVEERVIVPTLIPADGNQHVLVPVRARVSSGESGLVITLRDTVEGREFDTSTIPITISSSIETIALSTLVVLTSALLGLGVWRSVRRRRADAGARRAPAAPSGE